MHKNWMIETITPTSDLYRRYKHLHTVEMFWYLRGTNFSHPKDPTPFAWHCGNKPQHKEGYCFKEGALLILGDYVHASPNDFCRYKFLKKEEIIVSSFDDALEKFLAYMKKKEA